jgi:hypothetical protein
MFHRSTGRPTLLAGDDVTFCALLGNQFLDTAFAHTEPLGCFSEGAFPFFNSTDYLLS